jgi:hypothetical protein
MTEALEPTYPQPRDFTQDGVIRRTAMIETTKVYQDAVVQCSRVPGRSMV